MNWDHVVTAGCTLLIGGAFIYICLTVRRIFQITQRANVPKIEQHDLPIYWASYLINRDSSGITLAEKAEADRWLADNQLPFPADVEETGIGRWQGQMCDMGLYTFLT